MPAPSCRAQLSRGLPPQMLLSCKLLRLVYDDINPVNEQKGSTLQGTGSSTSAVLCSIVATVRAQQGDRLHDAYTLTVSLGPCAAELIGTSVCALSVPVLPGPSSSRCAHGCATGAPAPHAPHTPFPNSQPRHITERVLSV